MEIKDWLKSSLDEFKTLCKNYNWESRYHYNNGGDDFDFWLTKEIVLRRTTAVAQNYAIQCSLIRTDGAPQADLTVDGFAVATFDLNEINTPQKLLSESNAILKNFFNALAERCD